MSNLRPEYEFFDTEKVQADPSCLVNPNVNESEFTCTICTMIVIEPVMCKYVPLSCPEKACERIFCQSCIQEWCQKNRTCPQCQQPYEGTPPSRYWRQELEKLMFRCKSRYCSQLEYCYRDFLMHLEHHQRRKQFKCNLCTEHADVMYETADELVQKHWRQNCFGFNKNYTMCKFCKTKIESDEHSCVANLNEQIEVMKVTVAERKDNIARLTKEKENRAKALTNKQKEERTRVLNLLSLLDPSDFERFRDSVLEMYFSDGADN